MLQSAFARSMAQRFLDRTYLSLQRLTDKDADFVTPEDMLSELHEDEKSSFIMRVLRTLCAGA
jgi:hypothetical protein